MFLRKLNPLVIAGAALFASNGAIGADLSKIPSGDYQVDPTHAYVNFQYNHLGFSNPTLGFDEFDMQLTLDVDDPTKSSATLDIKVDSVVTGSEIFHEHLTSSDWFDSAAHDTISFKSSEVSANDNGTYNVTGDLTIKGVTKRLGISYVQNGNWANLHPL